MDDQLKNLFEYTKFHIGMYTTLIAGIIGVFSNSSVKGQYVEMQPYIMVSIIMFIIAGMAGGLIASSIPFYKSFDVFIIEKLGPWSLKLIPSSVCMRVEHATFWISCIVATTGLIRVLMK